MEKSPAAKHSAAYRARKNAEKDKLGIEKLSVAVPIGINKKLRQLMKAHGFDNRQELYQTMVLYLVDAPHDEAKRILTPAPSGFVITEKLARQLIEAGMAETQVEDD